MDPDIRSVDVDVPLEPAPDEALLVGRARSGDAAAFAVLVERYGRMVRSLAYASSLDVGESEDICQETFLQAWRGLSRFRGDAAFSSWVYRLARSRCIDRARRRAVRPALVAEQASHEPVSHDTDVHGARAVIDAARLLPLEQRQAVLMRDVQGLSYDEIAAVQGVPVGTVRSRIANGRSTIAAIVSGGEAR
jgi:RNA polymerase sigma-70 factor (ECF subfamily)